MELKASWVVWLCVWLLALWGAQRAASHTAAPDPNYLPIIGSHTVNPTLTPLPPLPPPTPFAAEPPIDFVAVRATLQSTGYELAHVKLGFHTGYQGNREGLAQWMTELDQAGIPFFLKAVDDPLPLYEAQEMMRQSGVPHTLVYRRTGLGFDLPDYTRPPEEAARIHWERHRDAFPPELDPSLVWIETVNEVDKNRSEWLAAFALETAALAQADGFRWAAFGWSAGEPERSHWEEPMMLIFLAYASQHPDTVAIALHEYSYTTESARAGYPYLIGRFQTLFDVCDRHGIGRPTVLITEWGWEYKDIPEPAAALADIAWAANLYAAYPQVRGAAIWYLGSNFGDIDNQTQRLIAPMAAYSQSHYFGISPGVGGIEPALFASPPIVEPTAVP